MLQRLKRWAAELKAQIVTLWFCCRHPDTPWSAKLVATLVVAYAFSPIDLIPDFIPVIGWLDELVLIPLGVYVAMRLVPAHVAAHARAEADTWLAEQHGKPRNYWAAAAIVLVWLAVAYWAWTLVRERL